MEPSSIFALLESASASASTLTTDTTARVVLSSISAAMGLVGDLCQFHNNPAQQIAEIRSSLPLLREAMRKSKLEIDKKFPESE